MRTRTHVSTTISGAGFIAAVAMGAVLAGGKPDNAEHTYCFHGNYDGDNPRDAFMAGAHVALVRIAREGCEAPLDLAVVDEVLDLSLHLEAPRAGRRLPSGQI
jgi:hypothetical protein